LAFHLPATVPVLPLNEPLRYAHLPAIDAARLPCPSLYVELVRRPLPAGLGARFASVMPLGTLARRDQGRPMADYKILLLAEPLLPVAAPGR
jgi:hypothetical protein